MRKINEMMDYVYLSCLQNYDEMLKSDNVLKYDIVNAVWKIFGKHYEMSSIRTRISQFLGETYENFWYSLSSEEI